MAKKQEKIIIFDTTLRDGEQAAGAAMTVEQKIAIAENLDKMGVDVIEAGFAFSSPGDWQAVNEIAKRTKNAAVCSLSRAKFPDIDAAGEALKPAKNPRIHTFISTSEIHLKYQFKMTEAEVLDAIAKTVARARKYTDNVEWSAMDATRTRREYLYKAVETAIKAGATTVNIPDTVGYAIPEEFGDLIKQIRNNVPNIDKAIISVHCQNDLGLSTANSLSAIQNGARQVECTINGLGERAGNTSLEEVVMAIKTRNDFLPFTVGVDTRHIMRLSRQVSATTGFVVQNNKAIVGANAFAHESGIHQDGFLKNPETYEIMRPEDVGLEKSRLPLGKLSGRHAFKDRLKDLGYELGDNHLNDAFASFKALADRKKEVYDEDIIQILEQNTADERDEKIKFKSLKVVCGSKRQKADLALVVNGKTKKASTAGNGPVDAVFKAIKKICGDKGSLKLYQVHAVTGGTDAQAEVSVRLETKAGKIINGNAADVDTLVASAKAYINALNKIG
jgi:2-isopropylmalate synthase